MTFSPSTFIPPTDRQLRASAGCVEEFVTALKHLELPDESLRRTLGAEGLAALDRDESGAVDILLTETAGVSVDIVTALHLLILSDFADAEQLFGAGLTAKSLDSGISAGTAIGAQVCVDVRPVEVAGADCIVFSDRDASISDHVPGPDHILGVGRASRSPFDTSPTSVAEPVLDLGAGCGIQSLVQPGAKSIVATDIHPRALFLARATFAADGFDQAQALEGSWFGPVAGQKFDRIVANPSFVVGPSSVEYVHRDSGLNLDGATELVIRGLIDHLSDCGTAHLLGAWAHIEGQSWQQRIASRFPAEGLEVQVMRRDVATPAEYIGTQLRDEPIGPRSPEGCERPYAWLEHFRNSGVTDIGFGYITVQCIEGPTPAVCEEMPQPLGAPFTAEVEEYLGRAEWLRTQAPDTILETVFIMHPGVAIERASLTDVESGQGFTEFDTRISRTDDPAWTHSIDESAAIILGALYLETVPGSVIDIMAMFGALDESEVPAIKDALVPTVVDPVRHGLILPTELLEDKQ